MAAPSAGGRQGRRRGDPAVLAGRPPRPRRMSIAEELARERAARRAADALDVNEFRGIDDLDSLDDLDTIDWASDPWDDPRGRRVRRAVALADPVGEVGRLHPARPGDRAGPRGRRGRVVVHPPGQPAGRTERTGELHRRRWRHAAVAERAAGGRGLRRRRLDVPLVRRAPRRAGDHARLLRARPPRPHGQRARPAAHAAERDVHEDHVPRGLHRRRRSPPGSIATWRR